MVLRLGEMLRLGFLLPLAGWIGHGQFARGHQIVELAELFLQVLDVGREPFLLARRRPEKRR